MKQGRADHSNMAGTKREPISHAVDPGGVSELGCIVAKNPQPLYAGRGFEAPAPKAETIHNRGSQGRYE